VVLTPTLGHDELLTLARKVQAAAVDGNCDRLVASTSRLYEALVEHIDAEHLELLRLPAGDSRLLSRGQQRIVDELVQLLAEAHTAGCWHCAASAAQLMAELYLQVDHERLALGHLTVDETSMNPTR
jgi:hypothetical protein